MSERDDLLRFGFVDDGGALSIRNVNVTLTPVGGPFYRLTLALPHGGELSCIVPAAALKLAAPSEPANLDIDALLNVDKPRPW
jgi:hypothetical protein